MRRRPPHLWRPGTNHLHALPYLKRPLLAPPGRLEAVLCRARVAAGHLRKLLHLVALCARQLGHGGTGAARGGGWRRALGGVSLRVARLARLGGREPRALWVCFLITTSFLEVGCSR